MPRLLRRLHRLLAVVGIVSAVLAPATQLAHAQAMGDAMAMAAPCDHATAGTASHQSSHHEHGATCCDFCGAACQRVVLPGSAVAAPVAHAVVLAVGNAERLVSAAPAPPHLHPWSIAPPVTA